MKLQNRRAAAQPRVKLPVDNFRLYDADAEVDEGARRQTVIAARSSC